MMSAISKIILIKKNQLKKIIRLITQNINKKKFSNFQYFLYIINIQFYLWLE